MASYVIGDIHGQLEALKKLLEKIVWTEGDSLYFVGDYTDWGAQSAETLLFLKGLSQYPTVHCLQGNHDWMMLQVVRDGMPIDHWKRNRGDVTLRQYQALSMEEQEEVLAWMDSLPLYATTEVGGQKYYIAHAYPLRDSQNERSPEYNAVWYRMEPNENPFEGMPEYSEYCFICGHSINEDGMIRREEHYIDVDCGAKVLGMNMLHNAGLAALRLDDGAEFYIRESELEGKHAKGWLHGLFGK